MRHAIFTSVTLLALATSAPAQTPRRPHVYDKIDAGFEAEQLFEGRRQFLADRQRWLNDEMVFWSRSFPGWAYYAEPWPFLPGDIYGYPLAQPPINRPVGRIEQQIGPNTWFSRPLYNDEIAPWPIESDEAIDVDGPREF